MANKFIIFLIFILYSIIGKKKIIIHANKINVIVTYSTYRDNVNGFTDKC